MANSSEDNMQIVKFYLGERVHPNGKTFEENMSTGRTAGVIQWFFPLVTPSRHVPSAPTLSPKELRLFRTNPILRKRYIEAVNWILDFYGISLQGSSVTLDYDKFYDNHEWVNAHSLMPITRILRSLKLLGFHSEFSTLRKAMILAAKRVGGEIDKSTLDTWMRI